VTSFQVAGWSVAYYVSRLTLMRDVDMNMKPSNKQQPVVGGIYRDKSGSSLLVLSIIGGKVLMEYANGTVARVNTRNWQRIRPQSAVY
jgi:hypothetical protein